MQEIANWASIITIFTFIIYITGRIFTIIIESKTIHERITWCYFDEKDLDKKYNIIDHICLDSSSKIGFIITPKDTMIRRIRIYKYNDETNKKEKCIVDKKIMLNRGYSIFVQTENPELLINYCLVFNRIDFMTCIFKIRSNAKNGINEVLIKCHHNFLSFLFYLFK